MLRLWWIPDVLDCIGGFIINDSASDGKQEVLVDYLTLGDVKDVYYFIAGSDNLARERLPIKLASFHQVGFDDYGLAAHVLMLLSISNSEIL